MGFWPILNPSGRLGSSRGLPFMRKKDTRRYYSATTLISLVDACGWRGSVFKGTAGENPQLIRGRYDLFLDFSSLNRITSLDFRNICCHEVLIDHHLTPRNFWFRAWDKTGLLRPNGYAYCELVTGRWVMNQCSLSYRNKTDTGFRHSTNYKVSK